MPLVHYYKFAPKSYISCQQHSISLEHNSFPFPHHLHQICIFCCYWSSIAALLHNIFLYNIFYFILHVYSTNHHLQFEILHRSIHQLSLNCPPYLLSVLHIDLLTIKNLHNTIAIPQWSHTSFCTHFRCILINIIHSFLFKYIFLYIHFFSIKIQLIINPKNFKNYFFS